MREAFVVETDDAAPKKLAAFQEYVDQQRWDAAIGLLREVSASKPRALVRLSPSRSIALARYCDILLTQLPPAGLAAYRRGVDAQAAAWLAEAGAADDPRALRLVAARAFASSSGDDAIARLAEGAWERGDFDLAREMWTSLVPLSNTEPNAPPLSVLRYPDTDLDLAAIRARLILCSIALGERVRAAQELEAFAKLHPDVTGHLAGRDGRLGEILRETLSSATSAGDARDAWSAAAGRSGTKTLGTTADRAGYVPFTGPLGAAKWYRALPLSEYRTSVGRPALPAMAPLSYYPVVWREKVFVADATRVYGFDLATGRAAWSAGEDDPGVVYPPATDFGAFSERRPFDTAALSGVPRHSITIHGDRLFARLGPPPTSWPARELRRAETTLVCLDLNREGLPLWSVSADSLGTDDEWWSFEGPPAAERGRLYVIANCSRPQSRLQAVCLDAATGGVLWNQPIGSPLTSPPEGLAVMTHRLATLAAGRVFVLTNRGAIVCLDAAEGHPAWVAWYDSRPPKEGPAANAPEQNLPAACLFAGGVAVAAPSDSDRIFAYDGSSGVTLWDRTCRGGGRQLLGAHDGVLVVAGERLMGLELHTGRELWTVGFEDPPGYGAGRGLLADRYAYWPTREDLLVVDVAMGTPVRRFPYKKMYGLAGGGNLAASPSRLLLATPEGLIAFGD